MATKVILKAKLWKAVSDVGDWWKQCPKAGILYVSLVSAIVISKMEGQWSMVQVMNFEQA